MPNPRKSNKRTNPYVDGTYQEFLEMERGAQEKTWKRLRDHNAVLKMQLKCAQQLYEEEQRKRHPVTQLRLSVDFLQTTFEVSGSNDGDERHCIVKSRTPIEIPWKVFHHTSYSDNTLVERGFWKRNSMRLLVDVIDMDDVPIVKTFFSKTPSIEPGRPHYPDESVGSDAYCPLVYPITQSTGSVYLYIHTTTHEMKRITDKANDQKVRIRILGRSDTEEGAGLISNAFEWTSPPLVIVSREIRNRPDPVNENIYQCYLCDKPLAKIACDECQHCTNTLAAQLTTQ